MNKLESHQLLKTIRQDGEEIFKRIKFKPSDLELPEDSDLDEFEYYVHESGFSLIYFLKWYSQLEQALSIISNFNYKSNGNIPLSRADHFIYNVENYMIRVMSIYDKLLQATNSIYHLCNADDIVTNKTILNNIKVSRTPIKNRLKKVRKFLMDTFGQKRNILIHQYSYRDKELRSIELMYLHNFENYKGRDIKKLKAIRANFLRDAIHNKKELFTNTNKKLYDLILPVFDVLLKEYLKQKKRLQLIVYEKIKY